MNRRAAIPLVLGLVVGIVAVKLTLDAVKRAQGANQGQAKFPIVQAKLDIKAFEEITTEMVQGIETSDSALAPAQERIPTVDLVIGRVAAKSIPQNVPILKSMLSPAGTRPGMVAQIPPGFRAVSVKIDEVTTAGYHLQPGDWVDVIVVMDVETGLRGKKETIAEVILQHVQVAAIGQGTGPEAETSGGKMKPAKSATLLVKEEDAPKLHLAGTRGKITLAMRGKDDKVVDQPMVAYGSDLGFGRETEPVAEAIPKPAPTTSPKPSEPNEIEAPPPHTILVFRGTSVDNKPAPSERITFESAESSKILDVKLGAPTKAGSLLTPIRERPKARPAEKPATGTAAPPEKPSAKGEVEETEVENDENNEF